MCTDEACSAEALFEEWQKEPEGVQEYAKSAMDTAKIQTPEESDNEDTQEEQDELIAEEDELADFFALTVEDKDGNAVLLRDAIGKNTPTLFILLRHFGCMLCRRLCGHLLKRKMDFYNLGIPIVAISTGNPAAARSFIKETKFPGTIYLDQKRTVYKALSCKRGVKYPQL